MGDPGHRIRELEYEVEQLKRQLVLMDAALIEQQPDFAKVRRYELALSTIARNQNFGNATRMIAIEALGGAARSKFLESFPAFVHRCDARSAGRRCVLLVGHKQDGTTGESGRYHTDGEERWWSDGYGIRAAAEKRRAP